MGKGEGGRCLARATVGVAFQKGGDRCDVSGGNGNGSRRDAVAVVGPPPCRLGFVPTCLGVLRAAVDDMVVA